MDCRNLLVTNYLAEVGLTKVRNFGLGVSRDIVSQFQLKAQNALPPPPPKPPPEKPPPPPPPLQPEPVELARGAETKTWCMSVAMPCMLLEKKIGLNPIIPLGDAYHCGGSFTMPAKACAQLCSTPSAMA